MRNSTELLASLVSGLNWVVDRPSLWPLALLTFCWPATWLTKRYLPGLATVISNRRAPLVVGSASFVILAFTATALLYLFCEAFWDIYESREVSVAALVRRGESAYPGAPDPERYCSPYGPALYLVMAVAQRIGGANVLSSKLPAALASLAALTIFWWIVRRQQGRATAAWAFTGLEAALLLGLRQVSFWAKGDSLILCAVTVGLALATGPAPVGCILLGFCTGVAMGIKLHALAYFLPVLVIASRAGWRPRHYAIWLATVSGTVAAPFILWEHRFPLTNHFSYLSITAHEGYGIAEFAGFCRWSVLLVLLVTLGRSLSQAEHPLASSQVRWRRIYYAALGIGTLSIVGPASSAGAGQSHLLPMIPCFLLAASGSFAHLPRTEWRSAASLPWVALATSTGLACLLVSVQTTLRMVHFTRENNLPAQACAQDVRLLLRRFPQCTVVNGWGGSSDLRTVMNRHVSVLAGQPIGLDAAAISDYQQGGVPDPDFEALHVALHTAYHDREVVWLLPRNSVPFALSNIYDPRWSLYPDSFRAAFDLHFTCREHTQFYDVYTERRGARAFGLQAVVGCP